jgi:glycosyltransferase involved in cell wall biosynthesis
MNIVCMSHLRWQFVFQRPQHLLSRACGDGEVLYLEEQTFGDGPARLDVTRDQTGVLIGVPRLPHGLLASERTALMRALVVNATRAHVGADYVLWFYTPMALQLTSDLNPIAIVYDCMDELSAFAGAPALMAHYEGELFRRADVVFTGGRTLFEAKRARHHNVHLFPSSVDIAHFARARQPMEDPPDQIGISRPRVGFFGVIDERMDYPLVTEVARLRPTWQIVLVGPTAKIEARELPRAANIHYLGAKPYARLPDYIAGWDVALLPFARNDATCFISPTKTPEYLAAGKPVVSTSIRDVMDPYGRQGLVRIADAPTDFVAAVEAALCESAQERLHRADAFLAHMSWDTTWMKMRQLVEQAIAGRERCTSPTKSAT